MYFLDCSQPHNFSKHATGKASANAQDGGGGEASDASQTKNIPTLYPIKSLVLRWRQVLSRFYPHVDDQNTRK